MAASAASSKWYFTREQLENTPSRRCGIDTDKELSYRQQAANLVQDMGQRLNVSQLTINTAIVYMHRFYMQHSFTRFHRNVISPAALFLAAKVEEQPRKLEHVIKVVHACLNPQEPPLDVKSDAYLQQAQDLVILESIILQTLGFEITIEHPHTDVVKCTQLVRASKDLAQTSYFMATNSLHLTTFCLQYKPTVIACVCIHLACKWSNWEIPVSTDGKHWWEYVDPSVTLELLDELTHEFLQILEKTPSRLKRIRNWRANQAAKKPKVDGQIADNVLPGSSGPHESTCSVGGDPASSASFPKSNSTTALPASLNSGISIPVHVPEMMATTSFSSTSQQDWPQHPHQHMEQAHSHKQELPPSVHKNDMICMQQSTSGQLTQSHHRPEKGSGHSSSKHEHLKSGNGKHHGFPLPTVPAPQKLALDRYREKFAAELAVQKRKLETLESDVKEQYASAAQAMVEQQKKRVPAQQQIQHNSNAVTSPIKMKIPISTEKSERHAADKKEKGLLKLRIPIPPTEKTKDELKMKIKVPSSERHSSSDEGSGKSKHTSPHAGKEHKEKRKDHSSHHHHHSSSHKHSHSSSSGSSRHGTEGSKGGTLRSPVGLSGDGSSTGSSSSRKRAHASDASHNHHPKMSKTSKTAGGLWTTQHPHETG
ncbi:cyclin-T2a isoform X4 [Pristis pectinata]|uniref:cyclin-T2a isoform X4 n=1 Tax=Pristis pectinata TaxID=685728 RepID=UPI00223C9F9C|nr:cyclin-T2a isoform X4 [Pristis pectinata]